ncbi:NADH-quinone oxidoreductase subunit NuoE [Alkalilimnicola sp. S0819]|uniref:NADH-quinone oxidoreductase subunit NuoE n=1 Tax=Alkalilimnicola sp. S0819 TaxID=2613922 RepID=UPI001262A85C|nr:NADH-quinone oxidoreductase subunit NuoE [Alkalilimnicola sp. S0819]KAB7628429.1 NADH-quinone oxidoreductase subunit NuoE [Alkalilimnicola sp. S0819]MPQ15333.1 NADH-quinone oxidoreductase subunit NuoE [Alkalilimnicola sp. S0819]
MSSERLSEKLLSAEVRAEIDHWVAKYPEERKQAAVIPALHAVQDANGGWISSELMDAVAEYLEMPKVAVYEVGSFYTMFDLQPVGRHKVNLCTNISCMLRGAEEIVDHVERRLGIKLGQTTDDGRITLKIEEECLAACPGGPMMVVDGHYHTDLTPEKVDKILDELE